MADAATLTTALPGIVKEIHKQSLTYIAQTGVMKNLVTKLGGVGYQLWEPYFDPTASGAVAQGTEGTALTTKTSLTTTRRLYTAAEWNKYTIMTDRSVRMASESTKQFHAESHGYEQAAKLETSLLDCLASGTSTITATSATGLSWAKCAAARTLLENVPKAAPKPYALVVSPNQFYWFAAAMTGNANYGPVGTLADSIQQKYAVASLVGGVNVFQSSYFTASATGYQKAGMFSKTAIGLFMPDGFDYALEAQRNNLMRGEQLVSTMIYGARIRVPSYCVTVAARSVTPS
jgi:hypothetical protein